MSVVMSRNDTHPRLDNKEIEINDETLQLLMKATLPKEPTQWKKHLQLIVGAKVEASSTTELCLW